jgi:hypothetical protein
MSRPLVLEIGRIRVDAIGTPEDAARFERILREGLAQLAERLRSSPFARDPEAMSMALQQIRVDDLAAEDWLGARGAARVAEVLYQQISAGRTV